MKVTLYGQLLEQRQKYENQCSHKKNVLTKIKKIPTKKKGNLSLIEGYNSDSSSDTTLCSWWSDVYGFDMRLTTTFIVEQYIDEKKILHEEKKWRIMPDPIITFFDFRKVNLSIFIYFVFYV